MAARLDDVGKSARPSASRSRCRARTRAAGDDELRDCLEPQCGKFTQPSIVESFHRKDNQTFVRRVTRTGLRARNSLKARLTSNCSLLPNRAESAGMGAAFIHGTFFCRARSWNT